MIDMEDKLNTSIDDDDFDIHHVLDCVGRGSSYHFRHS